MTGDAGHLTPETLADSAEGLLPDAAAAAVRAHVAICPRCQAVTAELRTVTALLGTAAGPDMPDDVAGRLDAALHAEPPLRAPSTAAPVNGSASRRASAIVSSGSRPRRRFPAWVGAAVVAVVVVLGVTGAVVGIRALDRADSSSTNVAGAALDAEERQAEAPSTTIGPSGARAYTAATLEDQVQALLRESDEAAAEAAAGREAAPGADGPAITSSRPEAAGTSALSALAAPDRLAGCVLALTQRPGVTPLAVDLGSYDDRPAAVIVLPDPNDAAAVDVRVVGPRCSADDDDLIVAARVPRP